MKQVEANKPPLKQSILVVLLSIGVFLVILQYLAPRLGFYIFPVNFYQDISSHPLCLPLPPYVKDYQDWTYTTHSVPRAWCIFAIARQKKDITVCEQGGDRECANQYGKAATSALECQQGNSGLYDYSCIQGFFSHHSRDQWCGQLHFNVNQKYDHISRIDIGCEPQPTPAFGLME